MKTILCLALTASAACFACQYQDLPSPRDCMMVTVDNETSTLQEFEKKNVSYYKVDTRSKKIVKVLCEADKLAEKKHHHHDRHGAGANVDTGKLYYKCQICGKVYSASGAADHVFYVGHNKFDRVYY
jgi:hypothetical protein